jgi:rSAM/selenodomain-associated transferase 1
MKMENGNGLILLVRFPEIGKVKTRLAEKIGDELTLGLYECFVRDTVDRLKKLDCDLHVFVTPGEQLINMKLWLREDFPLHPQEGDDLGERMKNAFSKMFKLGYTSCVIMGSDMPDVPVTVEAFRKLANADAVIAPTEDGGYYLLGFRRDNFLPGVFHRVEWSTEKVFAQTMDIFFKSKRTPVILPVWWDIDTYSDLLAFFRRNENNDAFQTSHTMKYMLTHRSQWVHP